MKNKETGFSGHTLSVGVNAPDDEVKQTVGRKGRNVAAEKSFGAATLIEDSVSIAKEIALKDWFENIGAEWVKEAASKTSDTRTMLVQAIIREGLKSLAAGANPTAVQARERSSRAGRLGGIEDAVETRHRQQSHRADRRYLGPFR